MSAFPPGININLCRSNTVHVECTRRPTLSGHHTDNYIVNRLFTIHVESESRFHYSEFHRFGHIRIGIQHGRDASKHQVVLRFCSLSGCGPRECAQLGGCVLVNDPWIHGQNLQCPDLLFSLASSSGSAFPPHQAEHLLNPRPTQNISVRS